MAVGTAVELDYRRGADIEVSLLWYRGTKKLVVVVLDNRTGEMLEIPTGPEHALHVFRHPYAYAASTGMGTLCDGEVGTDR
jgi:hypothetical protein